MYFREKQGHVSREVWKQAGASGMLGKSYFTVFCFVVLILSPFLGVTMPEQYGGAGLDILYSAVNWEEQSYCGATGPGWALHSEIVMPYILHYGTGMYFNYKYS